MKTPRSKSSVGITIKYIEDIPSKLPHGYYFHCLLINSEEIEVGECYLAVFKNSGMARLHGIFSTEPLSVSDIRNGIFARLKDRFEFLHTIELIREENISKAKRRKIPYEQKFKI